MASYQEHLAKQAARGINSNRESNVKIHFMGEFLKQEGDTAIVRFPYHSMNDIIYTATHVVPMPGAPYGKRIRCTEDLNCEFCAQKIRVDERVFLKFLVYTVDEATNEIVINNTLWDRPAAFADIELKGLMDEYGDLTQSLFKIKRSGAGKNTRYTIIPIVNAAVYRPEVYRADFTELETINAESILSKSAEQYHAILNPSQAQQAQPQAHKTFTQTSQPQQTAASQFTQHQYNPTGTVAQPQYEQVNYAEYQASTARPVAQQPYTQPEPIVETYGQAAPQVMPQQPQVTQDPAARPQKRYSF